MTLLRACCCATGLLLLMAIGCKSAPIAPPVPAQPGLAAISRAARPSETALRTAGLTGNGLQPIATVDFQESLPAPPGEHLVNSPQELIGEVLSREWLRAEIEARNASLEAMIAAWQAAAQLYPQRVALDDPMLMGMIAPQSAGSSITETAYALQLNQKLPWFGKRRLRGAVVDAEADAAFQDAEDARLQVRLTADMAFFEYFLAARLLEINGENTRVVGEFRETAQSRYRTNQVSQQDILQADLEVADLARRRLELVRMQQVAMARINTLLRRWPDAPLPPPPAELEPAIPPAEPAILWQSALRQRPDLAALAWRVQSEEAALELAYKNYRPDVDAFARYDTFWQPASVMGPLRAQIGVTVNLPVWREKLRAAVAEAQFRVNQRRAEFDQRAIDIQYEVISAAQQVEESRQTVDLYAQRLVPTAEQNVAAARANYEVNKLSFIELAVAERQLISVRERQIEAIVEYNRRAAQLSRVTGGLALQTP